MTDREIVTAKRWLYIAWVDCPHCGDSVEAYTNAPQEEEQLIWEDDLARCVSCAWRGSFWADGESAELNDGNIMELT